jgi:hypothetical protein
MKIFLYSDFASLGIPVCPASPPPRHKKLHPEYHKLPEPNPSVGRYEENTQEIRIMLRPSILRLFLGPLVIWPKV